MKFFKIILLALFCLTFVGFFDVMAIPAPEEEDEFSMGGGSPRVKRQFGKFLEARKKRQFDGVNQQHQTHPGNFKRKLVEILGKFFLKF